MFNDLKIEQLSRVNLIAGENNSGKTALLEAIHLLFADFVSFTDLASAFRSSSPTSLEDTKLSNEDEFESFWLWLRHKDKSGRLIELEAADDKGISYTHRQIYEVESAIKFERFEDGRRISGYKVSKAAGYLASDEGDHFTWPSSAIFSTSLSNPIEDADHFNRIAAKRGGDERVVKLLQIIEPRLQDLKYLKLGSQPLIYADIGMEDLIPTTQLGQGFTRLLRLYSEILLAKSKIILIDEIENGIHYTAMPKVWKGIAAIAREEDLQVFATTHSYECIRYAHEAFSSDSVYDLALHRLERDDLGDVQVVTLNRESLDTSFEMEWEVR